VLCSVCVSSVTYECIRNGGLEHALVPDSLARDMLISSATPSLKEV